MLNRVELGNRPPSAVQTEVTRVAEVRQQPGDLGDGVGVMALLGFHHNRRTVLCERVRGAAQHCEFMALDVDLDQADVVRDDLESEQTS